MRERYQARCERHLENLAEHTRQRGERSLQESEANIKQAAAVRWGIPALTGPPTATDAVRALVRDARQRASADDAAKAGTEIAPSRPSRSPYGTGGPAGPLVGTGPVGDAGEGATPFKACRRPRKAPLTPEPIRLASDAVTGRPRNLATTTTIGGMSATATQACPFWASQTVARSNASRARKPVLVSKRCCFRSSARCFRSCSRCSRAFHASSSAALPGPSRSVRCNTS